MHLLQLTPEDALLVIDVQVDFLPGGKLGVPDGSAVLGPINRLLQLFDLRGLPIYASRDWHPEEHCSFAERGGPWPPHCVAGTPGAAFSDQLDLPAGTVVVSKGDAADADAYSAFKGTTLAAQLRARGVRRVVVCGLATDYCVLNTVVDAHENGFEAVIVPDAMRAVDVAPGDGERAIERMAGLGALTASVAELG
jgi:nicotinamidase/pyrazinamidase